ncbi:MAG: TonB-dependent receptor [Bacteroidota bacterium]
MKNFLPILFLLFFSLTQLFAQSSTGGTIVGKVFDSEGEAVAYANVLLFAATDSSLVKGEYTNEDGTFRLAGIAAASYWVQVSFVGFEPFNTTTFKLQDGQNLNLPTIKVEAAANQLAEVEVKAERAMIEVQPDKTVFNVDGNINATGNTAFELLRKSPGVVVDNNDNIILSGKNGVQVYIDGKPTRLSSADLADLLRSMQSSEIDAIEIITNPSAKYDAEGNAGIINIRLKKDKRLGLNANVNLGYRKGINHRYNTATTFNYRNKKTNIYGAYNHNNGKSRNWMDLYRIQQGMLFDQETETIRDGANNSLRLGTDFFINKNSTLGVMVKGFDNNNDWTNTSVTPITDLANNQSTSILDAISVNDGRRQNLTANVNYSFDDRQGKSWNIDADWAYFKNQNDSYQPNYYKTPKGEQIVDERIFTSQAPTDVQIYSFRLDHERPLLGGKLGSGAKFSYIRTDNTYDFFSLENNESILDIDRSNSFVYDENINAAYLSYTKKWKKFNFNLGLRAEQTNSKGVLTAQKATNNRSVKRNYLDFFPSAGLSYQLNPMNQVRINYSRRIDRPNYQALNPFEFKLSELSYSRGNPFLRPQYTHNISLSHTYKYSLTTSLNYSYTKDFFASISDSTEQIRSFLETINLSYQQVLSLSISMPFSPNDWWSTYTSISGFHTHNHGDLGEGRTVDIKATVASFYHQSSFKLPKDFSLQLSGWYSSPSIWGAVYATDAVFSIDAGVQKKLFGGRANLKVSVSDIFLTTPWRGVQEFAGFYVEATGGWESRQLRVNFSYLLGNDQVKKSRRRKTGLEDEAQRVK